MRIAAQVDEGGLKEPQGLNTSKELFSTFDMPPFINPSTINLQSKQHVLIHRIVAE